MVPEGNILMYEYDSDPWDRSDYLRYFGCVIFPAVIAILVIIAKVYR